jgi:hypothetical protein
MEPTGPARSGRPDDRLRAIRGRQFSFYVASRISLRFIRATNERIRKRNAGRRTVVSPAPAGAVAPRIEIGLRRPVRCRARSPAGVPPRLLPRRVSHLQGAARARLRGSGRCTGSARRHPPTSSDAPRTPVVVQAGMMPGPPECAADEATPAGTALAPLRPASPGRRPFRARFDSLNCNRNGDNRQWNCDGPIPSFRGLAKRRARNPYSLTCEYGFRTCRFAAIRNDAITRPPSA